MSLLKIKPFSIDQTDTFTFGNANITGNIFSGNANLGNLTTSNYFSGNGSLLTSLTGANVSGQVANALIAGTVYTNAQPNITSVGTLTTVTVSGVTNLGSVANVKITGGTNGYVLKTDGTGNLSWQAATSGTGNANVAGSNTQIQFNNGTNLSASANLTFDVTTNTLSATNFAGNGSGLSAIAGANVTGQVSNALIAGTVYTAEQPNITSVGTLTSLAVTGNISAGNVAGGNLVVANYISGNGSLLTSITGANVTGTVANATYSVNAGTAYSVAGANVTGTVANATYALNAGNAYSVSGSNVTGQVSNALIAGTVYTAEQPNITSVGTLTSLAVTGNLSAGNINGGNLVTANYFSGNGSLLTGVIATTAQTVTTAAQPNITSVGTLTSLAVTGNISAGNVAGGNLVAANYISGNGSLLSSITGANVTGQVGNSLIAGTVYTAAQPNITSVGTLTSLAVTGNLSAGNVAGGNLVAANYISGNGSLLSSITGANVTGQVGNALIAGTVYTAAQPNITSVGTLTSLAVTGTVAAGDTTITGNLTVTGTTTTVNSTVTQISDPIVELGGGANGAALATNDGKERGQLLHYYDGGVKDAFMGWMNTNKEFTFASNVSVTDNNVTVTTLGKIKAGDANLGNAVTSNYFIGNGSLLTGVTATAIDAANITGTTLASGIVNSSLTSVGTLTSLAVTGNITAGNVAGGNLVSANYISGNGSLLTSITGANVTGQVGNALVAGTVYTAAQPNITSVGTLTSLAVTGNLSAGNVNGGNLVTANFFTGNGSLLTSITGANVSGQVGNALISGTVYTNAQPNITSVGTLANLTVSGVTTLGAVGNVKITGGSADYVLKTDGTGNLSWTAMSTTTLEVDQFTGDGSWTMKTLSATPASVDYTIVGIGGVLQPRTSYSVLANVITFSEPPPNGAIVEITTVTGGAGGGGGAGGAAWTYSAVNANTTAVAGYKYIVDTSSANITITLPATGTLGDEISIIDGTGNASTRAITIARNGGKIQGGASDMTVTTDRAAFTLAYYNSTQGWLLTNV